MSKSRQESRERKMKNISVLDDQFVINLIQYEFGPYYILALPSGEFGALWDQGIGIGYSTMIVNGNYKLLAAKGKLDDVLEIIADDIRNLVRDGDLPLSLAKKKKLTLVKKRKMLKELEEF